MPNAVFLFLSSIIEAMVMQLVVALRCELSRETWDGFKVGSVKWQMSEGADVELYLNCNCFSWSSGPFRGNFNCKSTEFETKHQLATEKCTQFSKWKTTACIYVWCDSNNSQNHRMVPNMYTQTLVVFKIVDLSTIDHPQRVTT